MGQSYENLSLFCLATLYGPTTEQCLCEAENLLLHSWYNFYLGVPLVTFLVMTATLMSPSHSIFM